MKCELCGERVEFTWLELCNNCQKLMDKAESDIASGRVQDAEEAFAELDKEMEE